MHESYIMYINLSNVLLGLCTVLDNILLINSFPAIKEFLIKIKQEFFIFKFSKFLIVNRSLFENILLLAYFSLSLLDFYSLLK